MTITEKELDKMVDDMFSTEEKRQEFLNNFAMECYNSLSDDEKEIYDKSTKLFTKQQCIGDVLSVLFMKYPQSGFITRESILKEHSKLYEPFDITESLGWVVNEVLELSDFL